MSEIVFTCFVETIGNDAGKTILRATATKAGVEYGLERVCHGAEPLEQERELLRREFLANIP